MTETWEKLPLGTMDRIAELEAYNRVYYRPVYAIHKWFAPRPGSTFRILALAALSDENTTRDDILSLNQSGSKYYGLYLSSNDFEDATILDPFAGGGTTLVEANRVGANVIGYEINPVAWWINKKIRDDVDLEDLRNAAAALLTEVRSQLSEYYTTVNPENGEDAEILYSFQTQVLPCLTCGEETRLFKNYVLSNHKTNKTTSDVPGYVYCPNSECQDRVIQVNQSIPDSFTCPTCAEEFSPRSGNAQSYGGTVKYTCSNGHTHDVRETLNRLEEKPNFEYYAIQYLTRSGEKKFKEFDSRDEKVVTKARQSLEESYTELPIPDQKIPPGDKTSRLTARNYEYFHELFSERQLLTYATLFEEASSIEDQNIGEFLITAISNSLKRGSLLAKWNHHENHRKVENVFARKSYIPRVSTVEANPINTIGNVASITNFIKFVVDAKKYCREPYEMVREDGETVRYPIQNESVSDDRYLSLNCKTSEKMDIEDESIDYVITDPPYYDNIQYSELAEYFYVWLHQVLGTEYDEMSSKHVPNAREIVRNPRAGKEDEFFVETLSNVFSECHRVLKDEGEMVFTYHHNDNKAWSVILEALIESGFTMTGAYPVQSEMPGSMTIAELDNAEYDILVFASKEKTDEEISLQALQQNLHFELQDIIEEERNRHQELSQADLGVILRGKCMYYYSKHYPNVYSDGDKVSVDRALDGVDEIIQHVLDRSVNLPQTIDPISQAYAALYERTVRDGVESHDDLNKHLLARNLNVSDLEDEKLVKGQRDEKQPTIASERVRHIEKKLNGYGDQQAKLDNTGENSDLLDIDKVHYLYHLYTTDQNTSEYLKNWKNPDLIELAEFMAEVTGDDRYEDVMQMNLAQF